jgi:hypothetical protein
MKLRELRKQRETLLTTYNQIDRALTSTPAQSERLQLLYQGLRQIRFAGHFLHPDVTNLEPVLAAALGQEAASSLPQPGSSEHQAPLAPNTSRLSPSTNSERDGLGFWHTQLQKELASGRLRSEIVYIFAALLEEWTQAEKTEVDPELGQRRTQLLTQVLEPSTDQPPLDLEFLDQLFARLGFGTGAAVERLQRLIRQHLPRPIEMEELRQSLRKISHDRYHSATTRRQVQNLLLNTMLIKEFGDALTLVLNELDSWSWPQEGISVRAALTPNKWRLFLNEDLPTATLLEILGRRWQQIFDEFFNQSFRVRFEELRKATSKLPPATRVSQVLELYQQTFGTKPSLYGEIDLWADADPSQPQPQVSEADLWEDPASLDPKVKHKATLEELLRRWATEQSVSGQRASLKASYRDLSRLDGYAGGGQEGGLTEIEQALAQINAELRLGQLAFPAKPIYVLKADLKDYYPSLSHQLILEMLARFGLNQHQLEFFRRYLAVSVKEGHSQDKSASFSSRNRKAAIRQVQRGVPNHRRLSDLLGELVMLLLDYYLKQSAQVHNIRLIDDLCLIATSEKEALKAWEALTRFCRAFGLTLNEEKSGAMCVGGELPPGLPAKAPVWSMLTLNRQGEWRVDQPRFEQFLEQARQQVNKAQAIISKVEEYNNSLNYLVKSLALRVRLDESHRQSVSEALLRFHNDFFEPGRGMVEELREQIKTRFLEGSSTTQLPDGWLHWPITAGGLSLYHPLVLTNSYARTYHRGQEGNKEVDLALSQPEAGLSDNLQRLIGSIRSRANLLTTGTATGLPGAASRSAISSFLSSTAALMLPEDRPSDWQRRRNSWFILYQQLLEEVTPAGPQPNQVMETLVTDFIERGSQISMGGQDSLSAYWRWIVYLYGPQIREQLGTFRFLITELVPAQLITGRYRQGFFEHKGEGEEKELEPSQLPF